MPWHNPGSMTEKENWSVTAYILKMNGIDPGPQLNAETAAKIGLGSYNSHPVLPSPGVQPSPLSIDTSATAPEHDEQDNDSIAQQWILPLVLLIAIFVFITVRLRRRSA